jgi:hypothetical protein
MHVFKKLKIYGQNKYPLSSTCNYYYKTFKFCKRIGNLLVQNWHTPYVVCFQGKVLAKPHWLGSKEQELFCKLQKVYLISKTSRNTLFKILISTSHRKLAKDRMHSSHSRFLIYVQNTFNKIKFIHNLRTNAKIFLCKDT